MNYFMFDCAQTTWETNVKADRKLLRIISLPSHTVRMTVVLLSAKDMMAIPYSLFPAIQV